MRILIRPRLPVIALLLLAPSIPELLTGSTPISNVVFNPLGFLVGFPLDIILYGFGALLIREYVVAYDKGWASVLLLGAAYGIAEEGFEVHTFFTPPGHTVGALGVYGHAFGVNWLWALVLTVFHATYSIALPILLTNLWFPQVKRARWFDRGAIGLLAFGYIAEVVVFGFLVGYGPSPAVLAFFIGVVVLLVALAFRAPRDLLSLRSGPRTIGPNAVVALGAVEFSAYTVVLFFSSSWLIPAVGATVFYVLANAAVLFVILRSIGREDLERSEFFFAVGMFAPLVAWDVILEFFVPGILLVTAFFIYLLYRLNRTLKARATVARVPVGAASPPLLGT
ncbi:MAG TPA: hypothetical protein VK423_05320 [Thermoplasmata archaeon]|nr:hypothetical protein [Thermoplasmata archaeon]